MIFTKKGSVWYFAVVVILAFVIGFYHIGINFLRTPTTESCTRLQFNETNREDLTNMRSKYEESKTLPQVTPTVEFASLSDNQEQASDDIDALFDVGFNVLDMIEQENDENIIIGVLCEQSKQGTRK